MVTIKKETIADIRDEIGPILDKHYEEVNGEDPLIVNYAMALEFERAGLSQIMVARDGDGKIIGYTFNVVMKHPRHDCLMSDCKALYMDTEHRGILPFALMRETEVALADRGVKIAYQSHRVKKDISPFITACGYEPAINVFQKRL